MKIGFLFQAGGCWIGWHYSAYNKRVCINLIPCCTIWIAAEDGKIPNGKKYLHIPVNPDILTLLNRWGR